MEALVVVDPVMMNYYKNEDVTNYVLTVMNMVNLFKGERIKVVFSCFKQLSNQRVILKDKNLSIGFKAV